MVDGCLRFFDIVVTGRCAWVNFSMRTLHYAIRALREFVLQSCKAPRAVPLRRILRLRGLQVAASGHTKITA